MSENLAIWQSLYKTDPKYVKPITGKAYSGDSPNPHYVIFRLTEKFGPVGEGFGWNVLRDEYVSGMPHADGVERLHECRIAFWWKGCAKPVESYGCTKALYKAGTKGGQTGYWVSDEDAAKKSLTDAIVKAASWLGAAGDIFMGQWNDGKYQSDLRAEFAKPRSAPVSAPETPHDPQTGEVTDIRSSGLRDAWEDGLRDSLPHGATDRQLFEAGATRLREEFSSYKSKSGINGGWSKYGKFLTRMRSQFPDLFDGLLAHYEACEKALETKPVLTKAAGEAIIAGIANCDTLADLDEYMTALRRGPNGFAADHPKIKAAYEGHMAEIKEANPAEALAFFQKG